MTLRAASTPADGFGPVAERDRSNPGRGSDRRSAGRHLAPLRAGALALVSSLVLAGASVAGASELRVTTLAGPLGGAGYSDGIGTAAQLCWPWNVASDGAGNLYVADRDNHVIRRMETSTGQVTTVAGVAGFSGSLDGSTGSSARFYRPQGLDVDGLGSLYVADTYNHTIRKVVLATGQVITLAGTAGQCGSADGTGSAARFCNPDEVRADGLGNLYVADASYSTLRKVVLSTGQVTTIAGSPGLWGSADGVGSGARFDSPEGVVWDGQGNLYVADTLNSTVRRMVLSTGVVTTIAGSASATGSADGVGTAARFKYPEGLSLDGQGSLYLADTLNATVRKIVLSTGQVTTIAGVAGMPGSSDGIGTSATFRGVRGVTWDGRGGLILADSGNHLLRRMDLVTGAVSTIAGTTWQVGATDGAGTAARFYSPSGVAIDSTGNVYVGDSENRTVRRIDLATGQVTTLAGLAGQPGTTDGTGSAARFGYPTAIAADGAGDLYVADTTNHTIRKVVVSTGQVTTVAGLAGQSGTSNGVGTAARFSAPYGVAADGQGNLLIADTFNHAIRKLVPSTASVSTVAGLPGVSGSLDDVGTLARLNEPRGISCDDGGNAFVTDTGNHTVRKIVLSTGQVTTLAGLAGQAGGADGTGSAARFFEPWGIHPDGHGRVYVTDSRNDTIRELELATGQVTTAAGIAGVPGCSDGIGELARLEHPRQLSVDSTGSVFVAGGLNESVRVARPLGSAVQYHSVVPCRVLDTRGGAVPIGGPSIATGTTRIVRAIGVCGVPPTAWAVSANVTVAGPSAAGYLTLWPTGYPRPLASNVNFKAGQVRANNAVLNLGTNGSVSVFAGMGPGQVDVILDVTGWFE